MWSRRKAKGLHQLRRERGNSTFNSPQVRGFEGTYFRGIRRLHRRQVAYGLIGTRMVRTLIAAQQGVFRQPVGSGIQLSGRHPSRPDEAGNLVGHGPLAQIDHFW